MHPDEPVCLCFRVSQRKLVAFMNRERPRVPSQLSECLGAGTGCHWCVPFLEALYDQWSGGQTPDLPVDPTHYAERRRAYRRTGTRATSEPPGAPGAPDQG